MKLQLGMVEVEVEEVGGVNRTHGTNMNCLLITLAAQVNRIARNTAAG